MFQNSLYETLSIKAPIKGYHESVEYIQNDEQQGFALYIENFLLSNNTLKIRHGTKEILSFLRKDIEHNVLKVSPKNIKILKIEFYKNNIWFLFFAKQSKWHSPINKSDLIDNEIKFIVTNIDNMKKAALIKGSLKLSFKYKDKDKNINYIENVNNFKSLNFNNNERTCEVILNPILIDESKNRFYKANELKDIRFITSELVVFEKNDKILYKKNLGTRGNISSTYNKDYFIFATGTDPIFVFENKSKKFVKPSCFVERKPKDSENDENRANNKSKKEEEINDNLFPILTSLNYYNNKFFGLLVDKKNFKTSLKVAYVKRANDPLNWFKDKLIVSDDNSHMTETITEVETLQLDLSPTHPQEDELIDIKSCESFILFIGKIAIQVWKKGSFNLERPKSNQVIIDAINEATEGQINNKSYEVSTEQITASWVKTFNVGAINFGCVVETDMGIFFINKEGIKVIVYNKNLMIPTLEIHSISGVNEMLSNYFKNENERPPASFYHKSSGFFGFRYGGSCIVGHIFNNSFLGWTTFSGNFLADTFTLDINDNLIMLRDEFNIYGNISMYDDVRAIPFDYYNIVYHNPEYKKAGSFSDQILIHKEDVDDYSIEDGYIDIQFAIPFDMGGKFCNKYLSIIADYFTTMNLDPNNKIDVVISSDLPNISYNSTDISASPITNSTEMAFRWMGDKFYTLNIDETRMSETGAAPLIERCKFVGQRFKVGIIGKLRYTEFKFKKIELYGMLERA